MDKKRFGIHLAHFRQQNKMTQQELAETVDCAMSTISRIENGVEYPKLSLFEKFNNVFERFGVTYEELVMEEVFEFQRAKEELLVAIHSGRAEKLERKLNRFKTLMDESNIEHKQYFILGYLAYMRKSGLTVEEFLDRIVGVFEMGRQIPKACEMENVKLTKIEHMMIYKIGMAHFEAGNEAEAIQLMEGLLKNSLKGKTDFLKKSAKAVSVSYANILIRQKRYMEAEKCMGYVLEKVVESIDSRLLFQCLFLQEELFKAKNNSKGAMLVNKFVKAAEALVNYMHHYVKTMK